MWLKSYGDRAPIDEDRLRALRHALVCREIDARAHRDKVKDKNPYLGAALSGRACSYREAIQLVDRVIEGWTLPRPPRVKRRDKARLAAIRAAKSPADVPFDASWLLP